MLDDVDVLHVYLNGRWHVWDICDEVGILHVKIKIVGTNFLGISD